MSSKNLNAKNLKSVLWETLQEVRSGAIAPGAADAVACQAREIIRAAKVQLAIISQANRPVTEELIDFAESKAAD
jgi:hypothetical protein